MAAYPEAKYVATRQQLCNNALKTLLGLPANTPDDELPRVGACLSGGGWRAMTSGVSFLDALATPLSATQLATAGLDGSQGAQGVKPLDTLTHFFGLSGGSWLLFVTAAGGDTNPYHNDPSSTAKSNPWYYGRGNAFDPNVHRYAGLAHMVKPDTINDAVFRSDRRRKTAMLAVKAGADPTIGAALASRRLGDSLVERWSSLIANDLLNFVDRRQGLVGPIQKGQEDDEEDESDASSETAESGGKRAAVAGFLKKNLTALGKQEKREEVIAKNQKRRERRAADAKLPSRHVNLDVCQDAIIRGDLPFLVCAAIANNARTPGEEEEDTAAATNNVQTKQDERFYDWVEFTPFSCRNPATGFEAASVTLTGRQKGGMVKILKSDLQEHQKEGMKVDDDEPDHYVHIKSSTAVPMALHVHHLMAVCGSAFACDAACVLPDVAKRGLIGMNFEVPRTPLLGRGTMEIFSSNADKGGVVPRSELGHTFGVCRDAGIDFNLPFPPMLERVGAFDVVLAMDAGGGSFSAFELARAVELGYIKLNPGTIDPKQAFQQKHDYRQMVRVFRATAHGGPSIVYCLGLTGRGTHQIVQDEEGMLEDVKGMRQDFAEQILPVFLQELRFAARRRAATKKGDSAALQQISEEEKAADAQREAQAEETAKSFSKREAAKEFASEMKSKAMGSLGGMFSKKK